MYSKMCQMSALPLCHHLGGHLVNGDGCAFATTTVAVTLIKLCTY